LPTAAALRKTPACKDVENGTSKHSQNRNNIVYIKLTRKLTTKGTTPLEYARQADTKGNIKPEENDTKQQIRVFWSHR
jgi:hypothetical protein